MADSSEEQGRVRRDQSWIMARNLLAGSGCEYDVSDIMNLALYLNGDFGVTRTLSYSATTDDDSEMEDDESSD